MGIAQGLGRPRGIRNIEFWPCKMKKFQRSDEQQNMHITSDSIYLKIVEVKLLFCFLTHTQIHLWRRKWQPTPVFLLGKPHGQRSLAGCSLWSCESDMTQRLNDDRTHRRSLHPKGPHQGMNSSYLSDSPTWLLSRSFGSFLASLLSPFRQPSCSGVCL